MRIVLDINVLVRAAIQPAGPAGRLLRATVAEPHSLITSPAILAEVARVLSYPRLQARWPLTREDILGYVERLAEVAGLVNPAVAEKVVRSDPDDDVIVQTAVCGRADVLCTRDRDLLDAKVADYGGKHGVRIMDDLVLLRLLSPA